MRPASIRPRLAVAAILISALAAPSQALADKTWQQPFSVPVTGETYAIQPYVDEAGSSSLNWMQPGPQNEGAASLLTASRLAGAGFGPSQKFVFPFPYPPRQFPDYECLCQAVANARGDAVAAWIAGDFRTRLRIALRPSGQAVGPTSTVARNPASDGGPPEVTINDRGDAAVLWEVYDRTGDWTGEAVAVKPPGGGFGRPQMAMRPDSYDDLQDFVIDDRGDVMIGWIRHYSNARDRLFLRYRPAGGRFGNAIPTPLRISRRVFDPAIQIAMNSRGDALIISSEPPESRGSAKIRAVVRTSNGAFGSVETIDSFVAPKPAKGIEPNPANPEGELGTAFGAPSAKLSDSGEAIATWLHPDSATQERIVASIRVPGAHFGSPQTLATGGRVQISFNGASVPQLSPGDLAIDAQGDAVASWIRLDDPKTDHIEASVRAAGGVFSAGTNISSPGQTVGGASVFVRPSGDALAAWPRVDAKGNSLSIDGVAYSP